MTNIYKRSYKTKRLLILVFTFIVIMLITSLCYSETVRVSDFNSPGKLTGWKEKEFSGKTEYKKQKIDGKWVLAAKSSSSASGLVKKIKIDLEKTPYINWSWRVENIFNNIDERSKEGDDYPARIYIIFSGGALFWRTRAINYVWSSNQPEGSSWPNAYTSNALMTTVQSGNDNVGKWVSHKRNIREDFKKAFGRDVKKADAIAIMTDTDNTGKVALSYYGDIYFSSE